MVASQVFFITEYWILAEEKGGKIDVQFVSVQSTWKKNWILRPSSSKSDMCLLLNFNGIFANINFILVLKMHYNTGHCHAE